MKNSRCKDFHVFSFIEPSPEILGRKKSCHLMSDYIYFSSRDELFRISLSQIVYCEAEGNFTKVMLVNGTPCLLGVSLGKMEYLFETHYHPETGVFARIGKRYIINLNYILCINILRHEVQLSDQMRFNYKISISKEALKVLKDKMTLNKKTINNLMNK